MLLHYHIFLLVVRLTMAVVLEASTFLLSVFTLRFPPINKTFFDMKIATALSLFATASAFTPATKPARSVAIQETKVSVIATFTNVKYFHHFDQISLD
jgi:hypothetical protein